MYHPWTWQYCVPNFWHVNEPLGNKSCSTTVWATEIKLKGKRIKIIWRILNTQQNSIKWITTTTKSQTLKKVFKDRISLCSSGLLETLYIDQVGHQLAIIILLLPKDGGYMHQLSYPVKLFKSKQQTSELFIYQRKSQGNK